MMADLSNLTPLTHEEAIKALKAGEHLVDGKNSYGVAHYHYYQGNILISDSYYDLVGEGEKIEEDALPQLYRIGEGKFDSIGMETWDNADEKLKNIITQLLDTGNFPNSLKMFGYDELKSLVVQITNDQPSPFTKEMVENILTEMEESMQNEKTTTEEYNEHISTTFNADGTLSATNYWESKICKNGVPYLVHHLGVYSLLLPENMDLDDGVAHSIYITRGAYQGRKDCLEIVFDNGSENPLRIFLHHSQVLVVKDMELGWKGQFYVYSSHSKLNMFYYSFKNVCYRESKTNPSSFPLPSKLSDFGQ